MFQTKRWNEAIRMADLKAQSPSLAITMRVLFGRTTSRRLRFEASRNEPAPVGFSGPSDAHSSQPKRRDHPVPLPPLEHPSPNARHHDPSPVNGAQLFRPTLLLFMAWGPPGPSGFPYTAASRSSEAIRMADLKAQSPSLAIPMRVLFGRTTSRRLRFEARRNEPAPFGF